MSQSKNNQDKKSHVFNAYLSDDDWREVDTLASNAGFNTRGPWINSLIHTALKKKKPNTLKKSVNKVDLDAEKDKLVSIKLSEEQKRHFKSKVKEQNDGSMQRVIFGWIKSYMNW